MADNSQLFDLQSVIQDTYVDIYKQIITYAPQFIGAITVFLLGFLLAHLLKLTSKRLVYGLDNLFRKSGESNALQAKVRASYANIISKVIFWLVFLFFIAATFNLLGWRLFTTWTNSLISYLPRFVTGLLIVLIGILLSQGAGAIVTRSFSKAQVLQSELLSKITEIIIIFTAVVIGIEQIGINVAFLTTIITTVLAILLFGLVLAFSLGAKEVFANIIGIQYFKKHCQIGENISIQKVKGKVLDITTTCIVVEDDTGRVFVPGKFFNNDLTNFTG